MTRGKTNPLPTFQYALLGLLMAGPTYGYDLHKQLSDQQGIGLIWQVKLPNLYAMLDLLEKKGWLTVSPIPGENRPGRKMVQLTEEGKGAYEEWLSTPVLHPREFRQDFMMKYYFIQKNSPEKLPNLVRVQLSHCRTWLQNARAQETAGGNSFRHSVLKFRLMQIESMVDWLEQQLAAMQNQNSFNEVNE